MSFLKSLTVATSLAPVNIELQIETIRSWEKIGFSIISVNNAEEIKILAPNFGMVNFVEAQRDASGMAGKPFVYLDDVLQTLEKTEGQICGIINSDIFLRDESGLLEFIVEKSKEALVFGSRIDIDTIHNRNGEEYFGGFDFFFFDKKIIKLYPQTDFCLGLPWWDYWLPLVPIINGVPVRRLITPFAYHVKHQQNWQQQFFETFGRILATYVQKKSSLKSFDREMKKCLSYIDEPEILNFCKCLLNYLKNVPEHIRVGENNKTKKGAIQHSLESDHKKQSVPKTEIPAQREYESSVQLFKAPKLKIAFFTSHPANIGSGSERLIYQTAKVLIARGHDARVYVRNARLDQDPPFFVHQMPRIPLEALLERGQARMTGWNDLFFPSTLLLRFYPWLRKADIWHFHNLHGHYLSIPLLSLLSRTKRIVISPVDKYLSTGHCPYPVDCERYLNGCGKCQRLDDPWPGISRDATSLLWKIKSIFVPYSRFNMLYHTQALADHYMKTFVSRRFGQVIPYGIDIDCFRKIKREDCLRIFNLEPTDRFVIGVFHSYLLEPRKGIMPLVKRLGGLAKQFSGRMELLVVGNGGHAVRDFVPPELSVTVLPYLRHPHELAYALNLCDILLYPTKAENLSLTCLNALACGVPVISYDAGGQKEAIVNDYNGYIVAIGDEEGMIENVIKIMENPDLRQRLSEGARLTAEEKFDVDHYADQLINYYRGLINM